MSIKSMIKKVAGSHENITIMASWFKFIPDRPYVEMVSKMMLHKKLNLDNPQTLNEKLNWLKLYYHKPEYTMMADKYESKKYVASIIGEEHVIPTLGVWDSFDEIDFESLPNQFVLKCTHDSGGLVVCKDKSAFDKEAAKKKINKAMKCNYFYIQREWPYKNIKPRIIAEKYMPQLGNLDSIEYKTTCFDGKVGFVTICTGPAHAAYEKRTNDHFTKDFKHMNWYAAYKPAKVTPNKPEQWDELIEICEKLSKDIPYLRVDCYIIDGQIYYGELTFYTWAGFIAFEPDSMDLELGKMLKLPGTLNK